MQEQKAKDATLRFPSLRIERRPPSISGRLINTPARRRMIVFVPCLALLLFLLNPPPPPGPLLERISRSSVWERRWIDPNENSIARNSSHGSGREHRPSGSDGDPIAPEWETRPATPLVIGAGLGTTATRTLMNVTCHLGLPSVHWAISCAKLKRTKYSRVHEKLFTEYFELTKCLLFQNATCPSVDDWTENVRRLIDAMISSDVGAIHDTPYPYFLPYVAERATFVRGAPPIIILSERDPFEWAKRRTEAHLGEDPVCRKYLPTDDEIEARSDMNSVRAPERSLFSNSMDGSVEYRGDRSRSRCGEEEGESSLGGTAFDILGCIEEARRRHRKMDDGSRLEFQDIFTTPLELMAHHKEKGLSKVALAFQRHQDSVRACSDHAFNVFGRENRTTTKELVEEIKEAVPALRGSSKKLETVRSKLKWNSKQYRLKSFVPLNN